MDALQWPDQEPIYMTYVDDKGKEWEFEIYEGDEDLIQILAELARRLYL